MNVEMIKRLKEKKEKILNFQCFMFNNKYKFPYVTGKEFK